LIAILAGKLYGEFMSRPDIVPIIRVKRGFGKINRCLLIELNKYFKCLWD